MFRINKKKIASLLNLVISISILVVITVITHTEFVLPPFLATATTKYPDPDWRKSRSYNVIVSYLLAGTVAVIFSLINLTGITMGVIGAFIAFALEIIINIEHPPSILATFLGILQKVNPFYLLHPILSGILVVEAVNYLMTRYLEPIL